MNWRVITSGSRQRRGLRFFHAERSCRAVPERRRWTLSHHSDTLAH